LTPTQNLSSSSASSSTNPNQTQTSNININLPQNSRSNMNPPVTPNRNQNPNPSQTQTQNQNQNAISNPSLTDEPMKAVWQSVRNNNGIRTLLSLLKITTPVTKADEIRTLSCKALLGLSRSVQMKQILSKLQISQLLSELVREPLLENNLSIHSKFKEYALQLIRSTTGKDVLSPFIANEATDPTARYLN